MGLTVIDEVVCPPGDQINVPPKESGVAVTVIVSPSQMTWLETRMVGAGSTVTVAVVDVGGQLPKVYKQS